MFTVLKSDTKLEADKLQVDYSHHQTIHYRDF